MHISFLSSKFRPPFSYEIDARLNAGSKLQNRKNCGRDLLTTGLSMDYEKKFCNLAGVIELLHTGKGL